MSLFREMYPLRHIESRRDLHELERMLDQAIDRGFAREIFNQPQLRLGQIASHLFERWFLDVESGEIFSLVYPGERSCGSWNAVQTDELSQGSSLAQ
jgi:hypothetical protein